MDELRYCNTYQVKLERVNDIEQRLDDIFTQVSTEITQERRVREAVVEAMNVKLDTVVGLVERVIGDQAVSLTPAGAPTWPWTQPDSDRSTRTADNEEAGTSGGAVK